MNHAYLVAVGFGMTLLIASLVLGGKDGAVDHGADGHGDGGHHAEGGGGAWAPIASLRFWTFLLAFGGGVGAVLQHLGTPAVATAGAALVVGWASGAAAVAVIRGMARRSVSSGVAGRELIGLSGTLLLPAGPERPGKIRVVFKGQALDYVARTDDAALPSGAAVLVVSEEPDGALLVTAAEM